MVQDQDGILILGYTLVGTLLLKFCRDVSICLKHHAPVEDSLAIHGVEVNLNSADGSGRRSNTKQAT